MPRVTIELDVPTNLTSFRLPKGVQSRLRYLLDKQDQGKTLTAAERQETEGLVDMAEWLSLLKLSAQPAVRTSSDGARGLSQHDYDSR
jgi:hypothetical protein